MQNKLNLNSSFWFGKYYGRSVEFVLRTDPKYFRWVYENLSHISIHYELRFKLIELGVLKREK